MLLFCQGQTDEQHLGYGSRNFFDECLEKFQALLSAWQSSPFFFIVTRAEKACGEQRLYHDLK